MNSVTGQAVKFGPNTGLYADLSTVTAATINQLCQAATLQQFYELDARGGTRYIEIILAHFNVVSPDARLQRPEYLGGSTVPLDVLLFLRHLLLLLNLRLRLTLLLMLLLLCVVIRMVLLSRLLSMVLF